MKTKFFILFFLLLPLLVSYSQVNIKQGTTLNLKTGTSLALTGNFVNNGTVNTTGTANFQFSGSAPQTLTGQSTFQNFTKSGTGDLTLSNSITINGTLDFAGGKINLGSNNLTIGPAGNITNTTTTKYIVTNGTGTLQRTVVASNVLFPVGNGTYNPVTLNNSGTSDVFSIKVQNTFDNPTNGNPKVNKQWTINEQVAGGSNVTMTLQWNPADEDASFIRGNAIYIGRWNGTTWLEGTSLSTGGSNPYTATQSGFTSFSPFGVANQNVLPVELASFISLTEKNNVLLRWKTTSELNNKGFEIERKNITGSQWNNIGFVNGVGNSNSEKEYSLKDLKLNTGKYSYRLKQIDYNGNYNYFDLKNEVEVGVPSKFNLSQNYPNPFNPSSKIDVEFAADVKANLVVYDLTGREVLSIFKNQFFSAGYYTFNLSGLNLSSGTYFYRLSSDKFTDIKKMVMIK
jgi:hypothetical protein